MNEYMREAIRLADEKMQEGVGGPFGAVIVKDGAIIARGWNLVTSTNDPTAHAEIVAIRRACTALANFSLAGCELYCNCEPCPMCLAAIYWAGIETVYYAATRKDAAAIGFADDFIYNEIQKDIENRATRLTQLMRKEALTIFQKWDRMEDKTPY